MIVQALFFVLELTAAVLSAGPSSNAPIIDLGYAKYQGTRDATTNITSYLGIRYADPPTGDLRWRAPQAPRNISGIQQAVEQPVQCMQSVFGTASTNPYSNATVKRDTTGSSEDCLFLNVYVPAEASPSKKLPVVVWIHGGGYLLGNGSMYDGASLVQEGDNEVISVVIQYRLGIFGFLAGSKVKQDGVLNAGLWDQEFALRWVQSHISKFGGDPHKVTIWGESAGAGSVMQHIIAHDGKTTPPLFRGAITSSTFLPSQYNYDDVIPEMVFKQVASATNCTLANNTLSCLRSSDVTALDMANNNINFQGFYGTFVTVPVIDGTFTTDRPIELLKKGKFNGERLLSVTNTHEGNTFVNQNNTNVTASYYAGQLFPKLPQNQTDTVAALYKDFGTPFDQASAIMGESIFICPTYYLLQAFKDRSFKGEFAIPPGLHGQDIFYYFPGIPSLGPYPPPFNNTQFVITFSHSFLNFVKDLDPNTRGDPNFIAPEWRTYGQGRTEMVFNETEAGRPEIRSVSTDEVLLERCKFWESVGDLTGQ